LTTTPPEKRRSALTETRNAPLGISQYDERKSHFFEEKEKLIETLTNEILPDVINKAIKEYFKQNVQVSIIVDSGTTLENFFPKIKLLGLNSKVDDSVLDEIHIYTNSLSGSDAFCKIKASCIKAEQMHLFGGSQFEKYRAVLGEVTVDSMQRVKESLSDRSIIVGLITSNWFLVGESYNKLIFCSSEKKHLDYKRKLAEISDFLIIVTPLGKLLSLDSTETLNTILKLKEDGYPEYDWFDLTNFDKRNKSNTILLTTFRNKKTSILYPHSKKLLDAFNEKRQESYTIPSLRRSLFIDHACPFEEQMSIELPHDYLHDHAFKVLQINR